MEGKNLGRVSSWSFHSQKSLLWVHGGHPSLPYSADLYQKQQQLLNFCEVIWPRNRKLRREGWYFLSSIWVAFLMLLLTGLPYFGVLIQNFTVALYDCLIEAAVSSIPALRHLAMEGIMLPLFRKLPSPI